VCGAARPAPRVPRARPGDLGWGRRPCCAQSQRALAAGPDGAAQTSTVVPSQPGLFGRAHALEQITNTPDAHSCLERCANFDGGVLAACVSTAQVGLPTTLREVGVDAGDLDAIMKVRACAPGGMNGVLHGFWALACAEREEPWRAARHDDSCWGARARFCLIEPLAKLRVFCFGGGWRSAPWALNGWDTAGWLQADA
jgi:hypothetical protein